MSTLAKLWLLALTYPGVAVLALVVLWTLGCMVVLSLMPMPAETLDARWEDDDEQLDAITRPAPLWGRAGGNWWPQILVRPTKGRP